MKSLESLLLFMHFLISPSVSRFWYLNGLVRVKN